MIFNVARFEFRYQLRNPVFWVALCIFFLFGFGLTASANVSLGTPARFMKTPRSPSPWRSPCSASSTNS